MPPVGFEPTISAGERPNTYALDRAATGTGNILRTVFKQKRVSAFNFFRQHCDWCSASGHAGEIHHFDPILKEGGPDATLFQQN